MEREKRVVKGNKKFDLNDIKVSKEAGVSRLEQLNFEEDDDDVYDLVDEDQYAEIVENRRKAGDFVVDDEGLGYYDNGEEFIGGEDGSDLKKRLNQSSQSGDSKITKRARKLAEDISAQKNSILKHLQPGHSNAPKRDKAVQDLLDIDALLDDSKPTKSVSSKPVVPMRGLMPTLISSKLPIPAFVPSRAPLNTESTLNNDFEDDYHAPEASYEDDFPAISSTPMKEQSSMEIDSKSTEVSPSQLLDHSVSESKQDEIDIKKEEEEINPSAKISLTKTTKKLKFSAPIQPSLSSTPNEGFQAAKSISDQSMPSFGDVESTQDSIPLSGSSNKFDPKLWLLNGVDENGNSFEYMNMYWIDAAEANGLLYIFGRIPVLDEIKPENKKFVSCCVVVHGCERNLFVLPRATENFHEDGSVVRADIGQVYSELNSLLVPHIVHRQQGQSFRGKKVTRKYAFEHDEIPREATDYLKIKYSAKFGVPSPSQCAGGKYYEKIFGASSSPLELFLLKRKLMGPCWITIKNPKINSDGVSWCKIEVSVEDPKLIVKVVDAPPAPPMTCMSVSIKTAVNPSTHLHEIIAISGIIHTKVDSDSDSSLEMSNMKRFTFIRQLGLSCGGAYPPSFPHDIATEVKKQKDIALQTFSNERALLSMFFTRINLEDPDIFASHNLYGFEFDVILARGIANKLPNWSLLGRLKRSKPPRNIGDHNLTAGRILCDTYKSAKELLRETTYSLTYLAQSQLKLERAEIDPIDVPKYFTNSLDIIQLARHSFFDCFIVLHLLFKLQVVPLTKQLTNLSGNLWSRTVRGARAERIEYLLLHEFHALKYILPEKKIGDFGNKKAVVDEDEDDAEGTGKVGGISRKRAKASYTGGLVLEPKKGLYDTYILLLDFNSLYPSIIQEYNLCFTTIDWPKFMHDDKKTEASNTVQNKETVDSDGESDGGEETAIVPIGTEKSLPPLPDTSLDVGVLPRVIRGLVDRRRAVKNMLKNEKDPTQRQQLDIRQKALKLTANSMYGCLGFSFSRFYARPIAALVTAMGREALLRTVNYATNSMSLNVIYGDTDSVMINTNLDNLAQVKELGMRVKKEVNKMYKALELDLDGIFRSMLLLKKKKYAALVVNEHADGTVTYEKEMKGLDLVRRDWCPLSKETGKYVVDQILSGKNSEEIVNTIHDYLSELAQNIRKGDIELEKFIITKGLNKNPKDYPDCNGQAHLQVALRMLKANKPVNIGDHIPYVICTQGPEGASAAHRAYHPDDIRRAPNEYTLDYEWYLDNQILPPISRLCEPIQGTSPAILSEKLGLDSAKYARAKSSIDDGFNENWGFTPKCKMDDNERFKNCRPLEINCTKCQQKVRVLSVMEGDQRILTLNCSNCQAMYFGKGNPSDCYSYLSNCITLLVRECLKKYYECWLVCTDRACGVRTMQQLPGSRCLECRGSTIIQEYDAAALYDQLKYIQSLFDINRLMKLKNIDENSLYAKLPKEHKELLKLLFKHMENSINGSAYNWIRPSIWAR